jgi:hypothetical protein
VTTPDGRVAWLVKCRGADVTAAVMAAGAYSRLACDL